MQRIPQVFYADVFLMALSYLSPPRQELVITNFCICYFQKTEDRHKKAAEGPAALTAIQLPSFIPPDTPSA
jgi:hypothetical protein